MTPEVALAQAVAADAVAWFIAALTALLLLTTALWFAARRAAAWLAFAPRHLPPALVIAVRMAAGFVIVVGAAFVFAEIAEALEAGEPLGRFDSALAAALGRELSLPTLRTFAAITQLGNAETLTALTIVVASLLAWRRRWRLAIAWTLALAGNGVLTRVLKRVFERVRPPHEHGLVIETGYSFPSGHSSGAVVACGMLAFLLLRVVPRRWQLPVVLAAAALAFCIGSSRVFLQVHYASDVLAGFVSGLGWLAVCVASAAWISWPPRGGPSR